MTTTWPLGNEARAIALTAKFQKLGIDSTVPGFCDSPKFLRSERTDPRIMESYAELVEAQAYSSEYLAAARQKIELVAEAVRLAVKNDGRLGACVDASGMIGRMLDKLGIWNYVAKATLTITYPVAARITPNYFWALDTGEFTAPHAIVIAPPFGVIDVTLRYQHYRGNETSYIPEIVLASEFAREKWAPEDLASDDLRSYLKSRNANVLDYLNADRPHVLEVMERLPPRGLMAGEIKLKYVVVAIGGFIEQLHDIAGYKPGGRTARQIFEQDVAPHAGA